MFWKKRPPQSQTLAMELDKRFQDLNMRFSQLEQSIEQLRTHSTNITIENVHIHQPVLEKMEYRLDNLDIKQLSGSLNLGNNFGAKISPDPSTLKSNTRNKADFAAPSEGDRPKNANSSSKPSDDALPGLQRTQTGYRLTRN
ncbi:hypothetical protein [Paenibacillus sp. RC67]|uniref:hypothetical protein n=1 Tax=Paenibacillus sp. RC67 TaxID=3039392 RepID=UPI0024AC8A8F|nr:hypothetical protein [Paenibacillus sp. RC67]